MIEEWEFEEETVLGKIERGVVQVAGFLRNVMSWEIICSRVASRYIRRQSTPSMAPVRRRRRKRQPPKQSGR